MKGQTGRVQMRPLNLAKWSKETGTRCPHCVDLIPPLEGFADRVEEEIIQFLESRSGTFDLDGEIATGDTFIRYCFEHAADAEAFHARFAPAAEKAIFRRATGISRHPAGTRPVRVGNE
jgi:hypothetical protein